MQNIQSVLYIPHLGNVVERVNRPPGRDSHVKSMLGAKLEIVMVVSLSVIAFHLQLVTLTAVIRCLIDMYQLQKGNVDVQFVQLVCGSCFENENQAQSQGSRVQKI